MGRSIFVVLIASFCLYQPAHSQAQVRQASLTDVYNPLVNAGIQEIEIALDEYYRLIDNRDLKTFVSAVKHASRGRLLLEQFLGENTDNFNRDIRVRNRYVGSLILIANYANKFTSVEAADMWVQDAGSPHYSNAKLELSILDVMIKGFKKYNMTTVR